MKKVYPGIILLVVCVITSYILGGIMTGGKSLSLWKRGSEYSPAEMQYMDAELRAMRLANALASLNSQIGNPNYNRSINQALISNGYPNLVKKIMPAKQVPKLPQLPIKKPPKKKVDKADKDKVIEAVKEVVDKVVEESKE